MDLRAELEFAKGLADQAGKLILSKFGFDIRAQWKADHSPVTQVDLDVNKLVIDSIKQAYPKDGVLGEEASYESGRDRLWVVDPIDGTQPYTLGMPVSTFCLALVEGGKPVLGVVLDPFQNRLFTAITGGGAWLNGQRLAVSGPASLDRSYVILSSRMKGHRISVGQLYDRLDEAGAKIFNIRSIAYGSLLVAAGTASAAVAGYLQPWDLAAAKVILEEAGAKVTNFQGEPLAYDETGSGLLVSNGLVHDQVLKLLNS